MNKWLSSLVFTFLFLLTAGAFAAPAPTHDGKRSDAEIEAAIRAKLAKSKLSKDGFTVHVHNGVATWQGSTTVVQHKGTATRMARTAGATQVVNNIKISDDAKAAAAGNLAGQPRHVQVKPN